MFSKNNINSILLCVVILMSCCGCSNSNQVDDLLEQVNTGDGKTPTADSTGAKPLSAITEGDVFLQSGYKIKTLITPQTVSTFDKFTFEVYVDSNGNGNGLVGYRDAVYDVIISLDKVYIKIADNVAIQISDFTGHMIPESISVAGSRDLPSLGFTMLDGTVISFAKTDNQFIIDGTYQKSDATFAATSIISGNTMTLQELITYILDIQTTGYINPSSGSDSLSIQVLPSSGSFWNNSWLGVTIGNQIYSLGDYCNPDTYYENGAIPQGMTPTYTYNADEKVTTMHISYLSTDGQTEFATTEGYVQAISTTCKFKFLEFKSGDTTEELAERLGFKTSSEYDYWYDSWEYQQKPKKEYKLPLEGWEAVSRSDNKYFCKYGDMEIIFTADFSAKELVGISISRPLKFA